MRHGLSDEAIEGIRRVLARYPEVDQAILYGSRAKGSYRPGSDIDLTLEGPGVTQPLLARIESDLDDLMLPYQIDLSARHAIEDPDVQAHITRVGQSVYRRRPAGRSPGA